ncbi:MAG: Ig-like domain-containing protein, partial [Acidobacteriota bacterium]
ALGCVNSPLYAPSDGQILVSANPAAIVLDEFADPPVTTGSTVVSAHVLDTNGIPQVGVTVFFTTNGGELASAPAGQAPNALETNDNGFVSDTLTLQLGDPTTVTVTARSGALTGTIAVEKSEVPPNQSPFAIIDIEPAGSALFGQTVIYDATSSIDPDGDPITCYWWQIESSETIVNPELPCVPPNSRCEVSQGPNNSILTRSYGTALDPGPSTMVVVTLRVTDDPLIACPPAGPTESIAAFSGLAVEAHDVVCDRFMPTANGIATPSVLSLSGNALVTAQLNGISSSGGDSGIVSYDWNCDNGDPNPSGVLATCDYSMPGTYTVLLTVTNGCQQADTDIVIITVNP